MCGTAAAASSRSTVMRTSSEPARARAATCSTVALTSAVAVVVIERPTIGAPAPTLTSPTTTGTLLRRGSGPATSTSKAVASIGLFMGFYLGIFSGFAGGSPQLPASQGGYQVYVAIFNDVRFTAGLRTGGLTVRN